MRGGWPAILTGCVIFLPTFLNLFFINHLAAPNILLPLREQPHSPGFEIWHKSVSLTYTRTCLNHSKRVFSDLHQSSIRLLSSHNHIIIFIIICFWTITTHLLSFLLINRKISWINSSAKLLAKAYSVLPCPAFAWMPVR